MIARLQSAWRALTTPSHLQRSAQLWDAAAGGNRWKNANAPASSPATYYDNPVLSRSRAEDQYRNNAYARKAVDAVVNAVTGANGIVPMFDNREHQAAWERWQSTVEFGGRADWASFLADLLRAVVVSGEAFVVAVPEPDTEGVPLRLITLGPEYLDTSRSDAMTFGGIRYAGLKPVGYYFFDRNPATVRFTAQSRLIPTEFVFHVYRRIAPGAQRGQTWLAPVLLPMKELGEYLEAALVRAKTAALYAGFVRTADGGNPLANASGVPSLEPGTMTRLQASEEVTFSEPPDAGPTFDPFVRAQLRRIAAGLGIPYEILSGDLSAVTFASGRHGLLEFRRSVESIQYTLLVPQFCEPILRLWLRFGGAAGAIGGEPGRVRWIGPAVEMLDARAEVLAKVSEIRAGLTSRSEAVSKRGWRAEDIDAEIAADNARADRLGLTLDSDPRKTTAQGQEQQSQAQLQEVK